MPANSAMEPMRFSTVVLGEHRARNLPPVLLTQASPDLVDTSG